MKRPNGISIETLGRIHYSNCPDFHQHKIWSIHLIRNGKAKNEA